jgi:hypothetical protein
MRNAPANPASPAVSVLRPLMMPREPCVRPAAEAAGTLGVTLLPGGLIRTGAPPGVGPIYPGDVLYTRISGIEEALL